MTWLLRLITAFFQSQHRQNDDYAAPVHAAALGIHAPHLFHGASDHDQLGPVSRDPIDIIAGALVSDQLRIGPRSA